MRLPLAAALSALALPAIAQDTLAKRLDALGATECADSSLTCLTLAVPRDHLGNDPDDTIIITFAISLATEPSEGIMFYTVGGPGGSGLLVAEDYVAYLDPEVQARIDFVFFDQRGIGPENGIDCPQALSAFFVTDLPLDQPEIALANAERAVSDCLAEIGNADLLPHVSSDDAIRDLEIFRQAIGAPQVWLYGESYGTQFSQAYATAYPEAVRGVILDGVIDLNLSHHGFNASYVAASEAILERVMAACERVPGCSLDMEGDAAALYDALMAEMAAGPIMIDYPLGDGTSESRPFSTAMLGMITFNALYGPDGRSEFLRVLAAASRGNRLPLLQAAYATLGVDPATMEAQSDPGWFGAAYYAITCTDYGEPITDPRTRAMDMITQAQAFAPQAPRLLRTYYEECLFCAFWPETGPVERPAPFAGGDYPTLILNADADPITPVTQSYSVLDNVRNGYMVMMGGGPHVLYGRGLACPDEIVTDLLLGGRLPEAQLQVCGQELIGYYEPLTLTDMEGADPLEVARAVFIELAWTPDVYLWDGWEPLAFGCDYGGTVRATYSDKGAAYLFDNCAFWPDLAITGRGLEADNGMPGEGSGLDVIVTGVHEGQLTYRDNSRTTAVALGGVWNGEAISTPRFMP